MIGRDIDLTEGLDFGKDPKSLPAMISKGQILKDKGIRKGHIHKNLGNNFHIYYDYNNITTYPVVDNEWISNNIRSIDVNEGEIENDMQLISRSSRYNLASRESHSISFQISQHVETASGSYYMYQYQDEYTTSVDNQLYPDQVALAVSNGGYTGVYNINTSNTSSISLPTISIKSGFSQKAEDILHKEKKENYIFSMAKTLLSKNKDDVVKETENDACEEAMHLLSKDRDSIFNRESNTLSKYIAEVMLKGFDYRHPDLDNKRKCPWLRKMKSWNYNDYMKELAGEQVDYMQYLTNNWYRAHAHPSRIG